MQWKYILSWTRGMFTLHPVCVLILVAKATDIKNEHQSHKHACCCLRNVFKGRGVGEGCLITLVLYT